MDDRFKLELVLAGLTIQGHLVSRCASGLNSKPRFGIRSGVDRPKTAGVETGTGSPYWAAFLI
jgi:hypothetical protein